MRRLSSRQAALCGIGLSSLLAIISLFNAQLWAFLFRDPVPGLYPFANFIWWATAGLVPPLLFAELLCIAWLFVIPALLAAWAHAKRKHALVILLAGLAVWLAVFWLLGMHPHHMAM